MLNIYLLILIFIVIFIHLYLIFTEQRPHPISTLYSILFTTALLCITSLEIGYRICSISNKDMNFVNWLIVGFSVHLLIAGVFVLLIRIAK